LTIKNKKKNLFRIKALQKGLNPLANTPKYITMNILSNKHCVYKLPLQKDKSLSG